MSAKVSYEKRRYQYFLWLMISKHQPNCYFCNLPFREDRDVPHAGHDQICEHHLDGDHQNMLPSNRVLAHRTCQKRYHVKDNINKPHKHDSIEQTSNG